MKMPGHSRVTDAEGCEIEHHRVEDKMRQEFKKELREEVEKNGRSLVRIISLRLGGWITFLFLSTFAVLVGTGNWISHAQVEHHENEEHKALITAPLMDAEHAIIEQRLAVDIGEVKEDVEQVQKDVNEMKTQMHNNYINVINEIRKIPTGTPKGP